MTIWNDNAYAFSTRDRESVAEAVLQVAVKEAVALIRDGWPGHAEFHLTKEAMRAERILGEAS